MKNFKRAYYDLYVKIDGDLCNIEEDGRVVTEDWRNEIMDLLYAVYDAVEGEGA